ncbi:hypothetical protein [Streptomyces sp. NPDC050560]|uniref:hypothetical protein n=1 Tax=Streptomyces sp. NPDC050560 TaxID=3365630 RepID=UPI0037B18790
MEVVGTLIALAGLIVLVFVGVVVIHLLNGQRAGMIAEHRFWRARRAPAGASTRGWDAPTRHSRLRLPSRHGRRAS